MTKRDEMWFVILAITAMVIFVGGVIYLQYLDSTGQYGIPPRPVPTKVNR